MQIMAASAVKPLIALLSSGTDAAKEHSAGALANLANGKEENQVAIGSAGAVGPLLLLLESSSDASAITVGSSSGGDNTSRSGMRARAASALLLLSLRKENGEEIRKVGGVKKLVAALSKDVPEAAGCLMNLALQSSETQAAIVADGALPPLVNMLSAGSPSGQEEAAGAIMNLVVDSPAHQKAVAAAGAILPLVMLLSWGTPVAKELSAAALNNLCKGNKDNRQAVITAQAVPALVEMIKSTALVETEEKGAKPAAKIAGNKTTGGTKAEAANCLSTLISGDTMLQAELVEDGALAPIATLLKDRTSKDAAERLLQAFDECFEDAISAAKS